MPGVFGSGPPAASLAQWIGWGLRAGVSSIGREFGFQSRRARASSSDQRSAWLFRFAASSALVLGECLILSSLSVRLDSPWTLVTAWAILLLLPRPTPRIPLFAARWVALVAFLLNLNVGFRELRRTAPAVNSWDGVFSVLWWVAAAALTFWAFRALWPRRHEYPENPTAGPNSDAASSNIPKTRFDNVGGMSRAKQEIAVVAKNRFRRTSAGIVRNGVLLYGPQGTGKNLLAEATAGEFRVSFHQVRCPELVGVNVGSTSAEIRRLFDWAVAHRPLVLFLDEIDSIGSRKQPQGSGTDAGGGGREYNSITTQLMQSIDRCRALDGLLLIAATNFLDSLEPTLIREGRFDTKLRLDLPDEEDRKEILRAQLAGNGSRIQDLSTIARRTPGWSPARLKGLVDRATLLADGGPVEERDLIEALETGGGHDRPALESIGWDDVVLPKSVRDDLEALLRLMEPGAAERLSLPPPSGLILVGAPGTGKTMTARLIASQSKRSFYSVSPSDVLNGAVGGSVKRLSEIFARAKENAPSILFFDEMDGLFPSVHAPIGQHDVQLVEQALIEISALKPEHGVFLIGTTNYLDRVDPRIYRGGRFSEKIEVGLPDEAGYRRLLDRHLGKAKLGGDLTFDMLLNRIHGMTPADLEATVIAMKRAAMGRMATGATELPPLVIDDLDEALGRVQPQVSRREDRPDWRTGLSGTR